MNQTSTEYLTDLEKQTSHYLGLIRRIDSILEDPVKSVIRIIGEYAVGAFEEGKGGAVTRLDFPVWVSEDVQPETGDYLFAKGLCFATLQKISKHQRRFSWLGGDYRKLLRELMAHGHERLVESLIPKSDDFDGYVKNLRSRTFGTLNPLTSAQIFNVLLNAGEARAHGERGFLAFFAMIWPLKRSFPDRHSFGAFIEPLQPKAYVTARCILPIKTLFYLPTHHAAPAERIKDSRRQRCTGVRALTLGNYSRICYACFRGRDGRGCVPLRLTEE